MVEADVARLAPLEAVCSTRPVRDAIAWDVPFTAEGLRFFAEYADKLGGEVAATRHDHLGMVVAEPYGVVGAITPWNFPLVMASWKVGAALAAGNAVVLKPSELTPFSVLRLAELAVEAGVPPGIFNVVQGDGLTTGEALTRHPLIAKMTFTGSTRTGAAIMASCAMHGPKPVDARARRQEPAAGVRRCTRSRPAGGPDRRRDHRQCGPGVRRRLAPDRAAAASPRHCSSASPRGSPRIGPGATWDDASDAAADQSRRAQAQRIDEIVAAVRGCGRAQLRAAAACYDGGPAARTTVPR